MSDHRNPFADNPSEGLIPLSVTPICMARLEGWISVITYFIKYLGIVVEQEQKWAQFYTLSATNMNNILESDYMTVFGPKEKFPTFLKAFSDNQQSNSDNKTSLATNIEKQLLPILKELLDQVKRKLTDPTDSWTSLDNELKADMEKYCRLKTNLRSILVRYEDEDASSPRELAKDPFLANTG